MSRISENRTKKWLQDLIHRNKRKVGKFLELRILSWWRIIFWSWVIYISKFYCSFIIEILIDNVFQFWCIPLKKKRKEKEKIYMHMGCNIYFHNLKYCNLFLRHTQCSQQLALLLLLEIAKWSRFDRTSLNF